MLTSAKNSEKNDALRSVREVIKEQFVIPSFQRGYRWRKINILEFINDIKSLKNKDESEINCIQRIVVNRMTNNEQYKIIDGQQRLTTIQLILETLRGMNINEIVEDFPPFYGSDGDEVSNFFRRKVKDTISAEIKDEGKDFLINLLDRTYIIWDDVSIEGDCHGEGSNESDLDVDLFTKLNNNRIPMGASDLFKAEMLKTSWQRGRQDILEEQTEMAIEWSKIESTLQDDRLWFMFSPADFNDKNARISLLFHVIRHDLNASEEQVYKKIINEISEIETVDNKWKKLKAIWKEVCDLFYTLQHWYDNVELYHLVGLYCIIMKGAKPHLELLTKLYDEWRKAEKHSSFVQAIKMEIKEHKYINVNIRELEYNKSGHNTKIRHLLLLHNVITVMEQNAHSNHKSDSLDSKLLKRKGTRFPFYLYKKVDEWNLEHISSQSGDIENRDQMRSMMESISKSIPESSSETSESRADSHNNTYDQTEMGKLRAAVDSWRRDYGQGEPPINEMKEKFKEITSIVLDGELKDDEKHKIGNLVLLDQHTNKGYGNAVFQYKRKCIIESDAGNREMADYCFILPCTRDVFSKYYTTTPESHHFIQWTDADAEAYIKDIIDKKKKFLGE